MNARKKILVETALVVVLGGGLAVAGGAVAGALPSPLVLPGVPQLLGTPPVGNFSPPVGDDSPPVGDDSAPKPDDGKDDDGKDDDGKDDDGFDKDKYYESKDAHDEG